jgi:hypothetical protein
MIENNVFLQNSARHDARDLTVLTVLRKPVDYGLKG